MEITQQGLKSDSPVQIACDFCSSGDCRFIGYRKRDSTFSISKEKAPGFYECNNCGIYFISPKPAAAELKKFYSSEYRDVRFAEPLQNILNKYSGANLLKNNI